MKNWLIYLVIIIVLGVCGYFAYKLFIVTTDVLVSDDTNTDTTPEVIVPKPNDDEIEEGEEEPEYVAPKPLGKGMQNYSQTFTVNGYPRKYKASFSYNSNKFYLDTELAADSKVYLALQDGSSIDFRLWMDGADSSLSSLGNDIQYIGTVNGLALYRDTLKKIIKEKGESEGEIYHSYVYYTRELDSNCKGRNPYLDEKIVAPCGYEVLNTSSLTQVKAQIVGDYSSSKLDSIIKQFDAVMLTFKLK